MPLPQFLVLICAVIVAAALTIWVASAIGVPLLALGLVALTAAATHAVVVVPAKDEQERLPAALAALAAAATVAWAPRVPDVEPTTIVWFERAEIAATIAVIPLAVHLTGLFDMIRGL